MFLRIVCVFFHHARLPSAVLDIDSTCVQCETAQGGATPTDHAWMLWMLVITFAAASCCIHFRVLILKRPFVSTLACFLPRTRAWYFSLRSLPRTSVYTFRAFALHRPVVSTFVCLSLLRCRALLFSLLNVPGPCVSFTTFVHNKRFSV